MTTKRKKLSVTSCGNQHYIQIVSNRANALAGFLRSKGIQVSPPGPCDNSSDTIALVGQVDVPGVQALLDGWA